MLHSTVTALLEAPNIDIGNVNTVAFLDLKKVFDIVDHDILLSKLHIRCYPSMFFLLFCIIMHTQTCLVNGSLSECCTVKCGIPQGTTLGPLLFLLYINDLPNCLFYSEPRMYVDDTHLTYLNGNIFPLHSDFPE